MMRKKLIFVLVLLITGFAYADYSDSETIKKTLRFDDPGAENQLKIDNTNGWIEVEGYDGTEIIIEVEKIIEADLKPDVAVGMKEVKLGIEQDGRFIRIFDDGPYREDNFDWDDMDYQPTFNFKVKVPETVILKAKTINGDHVTVKNMKAGFKVNNINGKIDMYGMEGYGSAKTINGGIRVEFAKSPVDDCSFKTINGEIVVAFPKDLKGQFNCSTMNGDVYTDFKPTSSSAGDGNEKNNNGYYFFKLDNSVKMQIGSGGPKYNMSTINGDIRIPEGSL